MLWYTGYVIAESKYTSLHSSLCFNDDITLRRSTIIALMCIFDERFLETTSQLKALYRVYSESIQKAGGGGLSCALFQKELIPATSQ